MITRIDFNILDAIHSASNPILDVLFSVITKLGDGGIFWIILAVFLFFFKKTRGCSAVMITALVFGLILGNGILKNLIARPRPFVQDPVLTNFLLIPPPDGFSCPSGHTLASFEGAVSVFLFNKKWGTGALVLAALIGFSRLYLYVHFPTDVLLGALLGTGIAILSYFIYKKLLEKHITDKFAI